MRVGSQFCHAHACKHFSPQWHYGSGSDPYTWCHSSYQASRRNDHTGIGLYHPTWDLWKQRLHDRDSTGSSIVLLRQRPDIQALCSIANLCDTNRSWRHRRDVLFLLAFMLQLYWHFPMVTLWTLVHNIKPARVTDTVLRQSLKVALGMYKGVKVNQGTLSTGGVGQSPMSNPSERRAGAARFRQLLGELHRWRSCAQSLADLFENTHKVALRAALRVLSEANLKTYDGKPTYKNIRLVRALVFATGGTFADTDDCWSIWRQSSSHVSSTVRSMGMWHFNDAILFRDAMSATLKEPYSFADMICFMCLQKHG